MALTTLYKTAASAIISWLVLLIISTVVFPYFRLIHDNSTIVEVAIGEGLFTIKYSVVYDGEPRSLLNTSFLGFSGYGPPKLSYFVEQWKMFLGVDCAVDWPTQHKQTRVYGIALWLIVLAPAVLQLTVQLLLRPLARQLKRARFFDFFRR